ncbi:hypothetical protein PCANC_03459 [Puccinia coronata f. sp. avenae]|uniref:Uncharacterized protein n=1 Tax=Puccinia coronata f. sp. avenae TaxID=200324 RepID=A0A2N5W2E2_9BASI|nr:hypothetical protein PCANC_03459 [Puccinia coronata f. sp. avenae]
MRNTLGGMDGRPCSSSHTSGQHSHHCNSYFGAPVLVSRATNEITQFPSYEAMLHQHTTSSNGVPTALASPSASAHDSLNVAAAASSSDSAHGHPGTIMDTPATANSSSSRRRRILLGLLPSSARLKACHPLLAILFSLLVPVQLLSISASFYAVPFLLRLSPGNALYRFILSLAFPLAGLLVPPYLGTRSDLQLTHRRTSSIPLATSVAILALLALSLCQPIARMLLYILPLDLGDWDPQRKSDIASTSMLIGTLALYALALALNALIQSARSILLDQFPAQQQPRINMHITRLLRLADLLVFLVVVSSSHGHLDVAPNEPDPHLLRKLVALAAPVLVMNSLITTHLYPLEPPPFHTHASSITDTSSSRLQAQVKLFKHTLVHLPVPLKRVCGLEMLSATCWLTILYHAKPLVAQLTLVQITSSGAKLTPRLVRYAEQQGTRAVLHMSIVALLAALLLPFVATLGTTNYLITRRGKHWNHLRQTLPYITPRNLWTLGLLFYSLLMASTFFIDTSAGANLLISFLGLSWALAQWVPLALTMEYIRSIEETTIVRLDTDHAVLGSPVVSSPVLRMPPGKHEPRLSEQSPLLTSPLDRAGAAGMLHVLPQYATVRGGTYLAIFSLASVVPHLVITVVTATTLSIVQLLSDVDSVPQLFDPADPAPPHKTLWVFRLSGLVALLAAVLSRSLVVPTSELDYWDDLRFQIYEDRAERQLAHQIEDG